MAISDDILDAIIGNASDLSRIEVRFYKQAIAELNLLDTKLDSLIHKRKKLGRAIHARARRLIEMHYGRIGDQMRENLAVVSDYTIRTYAAAIDEALGVPIVLPRISDSLKQTILREALVHGAPDREWWTRMGTRRTQRFSDLIRRGTLTGMTLPQLTREWMDETNLAKRQAAAQVRTGVNSASNKARESLANRNKDIIKGQKVVATLDMRTSATCRARDGMAWTLDGDPLNDRANIPYPGPPPYHWNCRSALVPVLKSYEEITNGRIRSQIPTGTRASMDGQVPADTTYDQWFRKQPVTRQRDILGPRKYELWKREKLSFPDMVDQSGNELTLEELSAR